jgi:hypothetical protein
MEKEFVIRSYGYCELAMLYFPNSTKKSASVQLRKWIKLNTKLMQKLNNHSFKPGLRILTPKQVGIIIQHLGEP